MAVLEESRKKLQLFFDKFNDSALGDGRSGCIIHAALPLISGYVNIDGPDNWTNVLMKRPTIMFVSSPVPMPAGEDYFPIGYFKGVYSLGHTTAVIIDEVLAFQSQVYGLSAQKHDVDDGDIVTELLVDGGIYFRDSISRPGIVYETQEALWYKDGEFIDLTGSITAAEL